MIEFLNPVDVHVGGRIRASRAFRNRELWELASAVRIPASCLIDYEAGKARCLPEHILEIAENLNVRSSFFFDGLRTTTKRAPLSGFNEIIESIRAINDNFVRIDKRECSETARTLSL